MNKVKNSLTLYGPNFNPDIYKDITNPKYLEKYLKQQLTFVLRGGYNVVNDYFFCYEHVSHVGSKFKTEIFAQVCQGKTNEVLISSKYGFLTILSVRINIINFTFEIIPSCYQKSTTLREKILGIDFPNFDPANKYYYTFNNYTDLLIFIDNQDFTKLLIIDEALSKYFCEMFHI